MNTINKNKEEAEVKKFLDAIKTEKKDKAKKT